MAGYLGASPVPQTIQKKQSFTATASQTTFTTTGYTDGAFINVYLNGVRLINGTDYTATNGSDIVLTTAASASDVLDFETFNEFTLVDQTLETPTFRTSATLKNDTHEDTDGGRESTLIFKGEQSGGEISTLAEIEASHDGTADDEKGDLIFRTNDGSDGTSPTEAARIDSSRNFIVGKTATTLNTEGHVLAPTFARFTRDSAAPVQFDRTTNDGDVAVFYKDGSSVGSIGTLSGDLYIGDNACGLFFDVTGDDAVKPFNTTTPAERDDGISLGSSAARFKNLYLSGGAYLGGTGSANRLEDYEEGTWTPAVANGTLGGTSPSFSGTYTKIGRTVLFTMDVTNGAGDLNIASFVRFSGLPFTIAKTGNGVVVTEDIDVFDRQGFCTAGQGGTSITFSNCGSTSGTTALRASVVCTVS